MMSPDCRQRIITLSKTTFLHSRFIFALLPQIQKAGPIQRLRKEYVDAGKITYDLVVEIIIDAIHNKPDEAGSTNHYIIQGIITLSFISHT